MAVVEEPVAVHNSGTGVAKKELLLVDSERKKERRRRLENLLVDLI